MPAVRKSRFGAVWHPDTGKLVEWSPFEVRVTRPWPLPRCWVRAREGEGEWHETLPHVPADFGDPNRPDLHPFARARAAAWATVPAEVRAAVHAIAPDGLGGRALSLLARCPGALDLAGAVPLLAGALASSALIRPRRVTRPLRSARALLRTPDGMKRWRRVAAWLGFDGSRAFVQLLRRAAAPRPWGVTDYADLRTAWADPGARKRLLHADRVDGGVVRLVAMAARLRVVARLHPDLLCATYGTPAWDGTQDRLEAVVVGWRAVHGERPLPTLRTLEALEVTLGDLRVAVRRLLGATQAGDLPFPPPPLPDGPGITALVSPGALRAEGETLGHCLGFPNWEQEARTRLGFGYAVRLAEERATLWVVPDRHRPGWFAPSQLRGPKNAMPSPALAKAVLTWLSGQAGDAHEWAVLGPGLVPAKLPYRLLNDADDDIPF